MNDLERMVDEGAGRLLRDVGTAADMDALERNELPSHAWGEFSRSGFDMLLADPGNADEAGPAALRLLLLSGYHHVPLPVREVLVARALLAAAGIDQPDGLVIACRFAPGATKVASVPWARHAAALAVVSGEAGSERVSLVDPRSAGVRIAGRRNIAAEPRDDVAIESVPAGTPCAGASSLLESLLAQATAAAITGASEAAIDLSVQYAKDRVQFGQPIGSFQAVQQALAIAAGEVTSARAACGLAFRVPASPRTAAIAKIRAGAAAGLVANITHQVHGAIGITQEYPLHFLTRRLWSWRAEDGSEATWAARLGREIIRRGADKLWPDITQTALTGTTAST